MKSIKYLFLIAVVSTLTTTSCTDDYFEFDKVKTTDWRPNLALPLINSTLTAEQILVREDSGGRVEDDPNTGVLQLIYDGKVVSPFGVAQVPLPNQNFNFSLTSPTPLPSTGGSQTITDSRLLTFISSVEVDSLLLKNGRLKLRLENTFEHNINVEIKLDGFTDQNNQKLVINRNIAASNGSNTVVNNVDINLNQYTVNMEYGTQNHSRIPIETKVTLNLISGNSSSPTDNLNIVGTIENLVFKTFTGYLGNQTPLNLDIDTININLFENFINGELFLSNPQLEIDIYNSYGIPTDLRFQTLKSRNIDNNPVEIPFVLPNNQNTITLNTPNYFGEGSTNIVLDTSNSNIDDVVSSLLKSIIYDSDVNFNPNGPTAYRNHITDTSKISLEVLLRLPFEGRGRTLVLVDTLDFDFEGAKELEKGILRVSSENGFPMYSQMQIYFVDEQYRKIDSLFDTSNPTVDNMVIESSQVNGLGETIAPTYKTMDIPVDRDRLKSLSQSTYAIIEAELLTKDFANNRNVRFLRSYTLSINVGIKATILIN